MGFSKDRTLFYITTIGALVISGFFIIPLCILIYVQMGNFCAGKTMLERYARSAQAQDDIAQRLLNSGIKDDASIIRDLNAAQQKSNYNDSLMLAGRGAARPPARQVNSSRFCSMVKQRTLRP
jgi:lipopolysaccharide export LptBFGC system permease protein LptF